MNTVGTELTEAVTPVVRVWLSESDSLTDADVFLVRTGTYPLVARCCRYADLLNYPSTAIDEIGWYRTAGIEFEVNGCDDLLVRVTEIKDALQVLENEIAATPVDETITEPLRYYRTGTVFGNLVAEISKRSAYSLEVTVSVEITDSALLTETGESFFVVSADTFSELLRVVTLEDALGAAIGSDESLVDEVTVRLREEFLQPFLSALSADLEDIITYTAVRAALQTP